MGTKKIKRGLVWLSQTMRVHDYLDPVLHRYNDWVGPGNALALTSSLEKAFARLMQTKVEAYLRVAPPARTIRVAVASLGCGSGHLIIDCLVAHALQLRGTECEMLLCDMPELPGCDERTILMPRPDPCPGCFAAKRNIVSTCALPCRRLSAYSSPAELEQASQLIDGLPDSALQSVVYHGWPISEWIGVSTAHFLRRDARGNSPEVVAARRRFLKTCVVLVDALTRWLDQVMPDVVMIVSGKHIPWRVVFELARARNIRVVSREAFSWNRQVFAINSSCELPDLSAVWNEERDQPFSPAENAVVDRFLGGLAAAARSQKGKVALINDPDQIRQRLNLHADRRLAVAFTNVNWDLFVAQKDLAFDGMLDWLSETIRLAAGLPHIELVLRAHPAENIGGHTRERVLDQVRETFPELPANVRMIAPEEPISSTTLRQMAGLNLVYCSTVGMEAAIDNQPVFISGTPHYRGKGFTIDIESRQEYRDRLKRWAAGQPVTMPANASELGRRYCYLFWLRYPVELAWAKSETPHTYELAIKHLNELLPGHDANLDLACQGILEGRTIVQPRRDGAGDGAVP
jgi:hypothetical protein